MQNPEKEEIQILRRHFKAYPHMEAQDAVKLLYQMMFGAEHALSCLQKADCLNRLQAELLDMPQSTQAPLYEEIGNAMCRVNLTSLQAHGITREALCAAFMHAARPMGNEEAFNACLETLLALSAENQAPFSYSSCKAYVEKYKVERPSLLSHSESYRRHYHPAYRVLPVYYAKLLPLLSELERRDAQGQNTLLALEGNCCAGKTSLAGLLQSLYGCDVIHMDDFFLPLALRTPERLCTPGGNIHHERFLEEVANPLGRGETAVYRKFDCASQRYNRGKLTAKANGLLVVEGVYALHPDYRSLYGVKVFLSADEQTQQKRLLQRGDDPKRFMEEWIPMENAYFSAMGISGACDFTLRL